MGKTIVLTGASSGFGKAALAALLARGNTVIAGVRGGEGRAAALFGAEIAALPGRLIAVDLHMERSETFAGVVRVVEERLGRRLDVLVNNAGYGLLGPFEDQSPEQVRHQFEVNVFGPMFLTRALLPALRAARGRIINVGSIAGILATPFYGTYSATKHALAAHSESLYYELRPHGVQVALVEPGSFKTEFAGRSLALAEGSRDPSSPYHDEMKRFEHNIRTYALRLGDPARVAALIVRLCERKHIPLHNLIGPDARALALLKRTLPSRWRLEAMDVGFRKTMLR